MLQKKKLEEINHHNACVLREWKSVVSGSLEYYNNKMRMDHMEDCCWFQKNCTIWRCLLVFQDAADVQSNLFFGTWQSLIAI